MLGFLLLGTEILLLSAMRADASISDGETCSELLENRGSERISVRGSEGRSWYGQLLYESRGYEMNVTFDLGEIPSDISHSRDLYFEGPVCFSVERVWIQSTRKDGEEGKALVQLRTDAGILVGAVSGSLRQCPSFRFECVLHSAPDFMETAPLKYSPLTLEFWTTFKDNRMFDKNWIRAIEIHTIEGNIPSEWVSHLSSVSLQRMHVSGNDWRRVETPLGYLPSLWLVNFKDNNIEVLPDDAFDGTPRLKQLNLSGNKLRQLPFGLEKQRELIGFHLENQRGRSVFQLSDRTSPSLKKMHVISLWNVTVRIDLCNISELVNLRIILVINSEILSVKEEMHCTDSNQDISDLNLSRNNLTALPSSLIKRMTNLRSLLVPGNLLTDCPRSVLETLRNLKALDLGSNRLRKLTADCFRSLEHLTYLTLSGNEIVSIEKTTFVSLVRLRGLYLSRNKLVSIEGGTFSSVRSLRTLDLSSNKLSNIHYSIFSADDVDKRFKTVHIDKVDFSFNKLTEVTLRTQSMPFIKELDLSWNCIRKIEVIEVKSLNLSYNSFELIPDGLVTIPYALKSVDFGGNNITCCHPNNVILSNSTVTIFNLGTRQPLSCFLSGHEITSKTVLFNTSVCDVVESDPTSYVELWVCLGVFTAVATVFMSFVFYYRTELAYLGLFAKILKRGMKTDEQKYKDASYDAFVCYCGKNLAWIVRYLLGSIEGAEERYRLCIHDRDFTLGAAIDTNVLSALDRSRKVIFVLSPDFMSRKWCRWELEMATHKMFEEERHYIILIELESLKGVVLPKQLKFLMKSRTYLRWPGDGASEEKTAKFWEGLRKALGPSLFCKMGRRLPMISVLDIDRE